MGPSIDPITDGSSTSTADKDFRHFMIDRLKRLASSGYWRTVGLRKAKKCSDPTADDHFPKKRTKESLESEESTLNHVFQDIYEMNGLYMEHTMSLDQLMDIYPLSRLDPKNPARSRGLNDDEAALKLAAGERNQIHPLSSRRYRLRMFLGQFLNAFRLLLLMAGIICALIFALDSSRTNELVMAIILFTTLLFMCGIGYFEQKKTLKQISGFQSMLPSQCTVIREGRELRLSANEIVVGDVVRLRFGDRVPADMRLLSSDGLRIETSWITGELEPLAYTHEQSNAGVGVLESQNVAFSGSSCTAGEGIGIVIRIGNKTLVGRLIELMSKSKRVSSCLDLEHHRFVRFITIVALTMATFTFLFGLIMNRFSQLVNTFINGFLIVMVANVPQGLPVTLTSQLLIVARRLWRRCGGMCLKQLDMADTLGRSTVIMTDKSGILSSDGPAVTDIWLEGDFFTADDLVVQTHAKDTENVPYGSLKQLLEVMSVCDSAHIESYPNSNYNTVTSTGGFVRRKTPRNSLRKVHPIDIEEPPTINVGKLPDFPAVVADKCMKASAKSRPSIQSAGTYSLRHVDLKERSVSGRPTDVGLIKFVERVTSAQKLRDTYELKHEVPFSPYRRYHLVIVTNQRPPISEIESENEPLNEEEDGLVTYKLLVKGAPEELIRNCSHIVGPGGKVDTITDEHIAQFEEAYIKMAGQGKSCLAFASVEFQDFADALFFSSLHDGHSVNSKILDRYSQFPQNGWCFLGMVGMWSPPRSGISEAIRRIDRAGIRLFIVTGDHPATAEALANQIGFSPAQTATNLMSKDEINGDIGIHSDGYSSTMETVSGKVAVPIRPPSSSSDQASESADSEEVRSEDYQSISSSQLVVVHGDSLTDLPEDEIHNILGRRRLCQSGPHKDVVTLTGDGLMDAIALKQSNIGIAVEAGGSVFAKEASDIVVQENDLSNLVRAVEEARILFDNVKKTIAYTLSHLLPELLPVLLSFILGFPLGLTSLQVLTIDLLTEIPPSIALVFEPAERDVMKQRPRRENSRLVTPALLFYSYIMAGTIVSVGCMLAYFTVFWMNGFSLKDLLFTSDKYWHPGAVNFNASSGAVYDYRQQMDIRAQANAAWHLTLVMSQVAHLFTCTTRRVSLFRHGIRNWVLVAAVVFEVAFLMFLLFTPAVQRLMEIVPPPASIWLFSLAVGIVLLAFNEIRKYFIRRNPRHRLVKLIKW
ncbi:e1-E2 ATPase domain-containing protein [Ditylenchus destructor]|nr:e1-E2 ATPase domain-containing protein [Ditylenchus destructor]